jgi:hypothetical protein
VIHSVINPLRKVSGALHVYDGDFFGTARSMWDAETLAEEPYDRNKVVKGKPIKGGPAPSKELSSGEDDHDLCHLQGELVQASASERPRSTRPPDTRYTRTRLRPPSRLRGANCQSAPAPA